MAQNTLKVDVVEAKNLLAADKGGTSDPYCKLRIGSSTQKTKTVKKCLAPRWNETFTFKVADPKTASLIIEVFDYDTFGKDDPLGSISIPLSKLERGVESAAWHNLTGVPKGQVHLKLTAIDFGADPTPKDQSNAGGPQGYPSAAINQMPGGYPSNAAQPVGGFPPNPYASQQAPGGYPPMGQPGGYPPNPYGPPPGAFPDPYASNPYGGAPPGAYPPGAYPPNAYPQQGGYPPNAYGAPPGAYPPGAYPPA